MRGGTMNTCPVCGYIMRYPPTDHHICPSCGTEFGYDDVGIGYALLRERWVQAGARWWSPVDPQPENWRPYEQLMRLFVTADPIPPMSETRSASFGFFGAQHIPGLQLSTRVKRPRRKSRYA